jgi:putative phage-type endonuclease
MAGLNIQQGTKEWLEIRRGYITASEAPVIMEKSPWKTPFQLWREKTRRVPEPERTIYMQYGTDHEEEARVAFESFTRLYVAPKVMIKDFCLASLDGITIEGDAIVEIKCPGVKDHTTALNGKVPDKYVPQIMHQLYVSDAEVAYYWSWRPESTALIEVKPNKDYIVSLLEKEKEFWECLQTDFPPPLTKRDK